MKKAQISNTLILWMIFVFVLVVVVYYIGVPFFKNTILPWANNLWGGSGSVSGGGQTSGGSSGGGVAISPVVIPNIQTGEDECSFQIGYLGEFAGEDRVIYLYDQDTKNPGSTGLEFPNSFDAFAGNTNSFIHYHTPQTLYGLSMTSAYNIGSAYNLYFFNLKSKTGIGVSDVSNFKRLEGAYIKPSDAISPENIKNKNLQPAICITKTTKGLQDKRLKEKEIGYVSSLIDKEGNIISGGDYISLALGRGGGLNTENSHIFWTNIKIIGTRLLLFSNTDDLSAIGTIPGSEALEVGKIENGKIIMNPSFTDKIPLAPNSVTNEEAYVKRLAIPLASYLSNEDCKNYGLETERGYCWWSEVANVLKKLDGAEIVERGLVSDTNNIHGPRQSIIKVIIKS